MSKIALIVLLLLIAGAALYFFYAAQEGASAYSPTTPSEAPPAQTPPSETAPAQTPPAPPPPVTPTPAQPPFGAGNYEVNYTVRAVVFVGGFGLQISGWNVVGVGPSGNYSFGKLTVDVPGQGPVEILFKSATEGNLTYIVNCAAGQCQAEVAPADDAMFSLVAGANATRTPKGHCVQLGYDGELYEERGRLGPETFAQILGDLQGNGTGTYVVDICEVRGVPLSVKGDLYMNMTVYGQRLTVKMTVTYAATTASPFSPERYTQLLQEVKTAHRTEA